MTARAAANRLPVGSAIGAFPTLLPEEVFYGACARYAAQMRFPNHAGAATALFGAPTAGVAVDLPRRLGAFAARLPQGHAYAPEHVRRHHTLLPFYRPFVEPARARLVAAAMDAADGGGRAAARVSAAILLGLSASTVDTPSRLRFCAGCAGADERDCGEGVWRRVHQLPGVLVCPTHGTPLLEASARTNGAVASRELRPLNDDVRATATPLVVPVASSARALAADAQWLLERDVRPRGLAWLTARYREAMIASGWLVPSRRKLPMAELTRAFEAHAGSSWLAAVSCTIDVSANGQSWLSRLLRKSRRAAHPVQHLLVIRFLGYTPDEFLADDPLPPPSRRPTPADACASPGPGPASASGRAWDDAVRAALADGRRPQREVARALGVSADVLRRERARLARSASVPAGVDDVSGTDARPSRALAARIERFRAEWIALRAAHPTATRSELAGLAPDAARALHRYDGEWLNRHQPPSRRGGGARGAPRVAWAERDAAMRAEILAAAERVRAAAGRPRRVTRLALARGTSCADLVLHKRNRAKLPAMEAAVIAALESREDCARRRLQWAAAGYRDESRVPTAAELLARAGATARGLAGVLWAEAVAAAEALRAEVPRTPAI